MTYTAEEKICILFGHNGLSASKFYRLLDLYGSVTEIVKNFHNSQVEKIVGDTYKSLCHQLKNNAVEDILAKMDGCGVAVTTYLSDTFPQSLVNIPDPPYILFCRGNLQLLNSRCLGIVGTRKVSSYGKRVTTDFTTVLSEHFTIVSGLAYGVDGIAHETTLKEKGKTIAVLGGGVVNVYPSAHQNLAESIVDSGGLLVSEYGMEASPLQYRFPHRNRIVSGLSVGLLVCQSPVQSGTSSTVEWALEQGKDVFAVPGEIYDSGFSGNNRLIKSMQGVCITTPRDILDYYHIDSAKTETQSYQISLDEQKVLDALVTGPLTFDQLVDKTKISAGELNFLLANLEIKSIIARLPGNMYRSYGGTK